MSHLSKIFEEAPVKVQNKNGFDLSHLNVGTAKCGTLTPVLCKLLPPNSDFTLGVNMEVSLPPLATTFYGRVDAIVEGFVIPCSILYGGWKQFISNQQSTMFTAAQSGFPSNGQYVLPVAYFEYNEDSSTEQWVDDFLSNDSLLDYLGARLDLTSPTADGYAGCFNMLPFLAYHLIWDVYYRNKQITRTIFQVNPNQQSSSSNKFNVSLIWHSYYPNEGETFTATDGNASRFPDGKWFWQMRQRNYARDYFTAATPSPQQGNASKLRFNVSSGSGEFTIAALRAANSLQKFLETNNLSGDYAEMMRNRWGTRPIDADFDEPYYLGRVIVPVYQKSVYQQDSSAKAGASNPFAAVGAIGTKGASGSFSGEGSICDKFHNTTWAYVMCLFSLVPHAMYGYGLNRELTMTSLGDFPAPELQSVGNEAIYSFELWYNFDESIDMRDSELVDGLSTFGYIPRYSRFKYMDDEVHGEMRPGRTLDAFVLQREFSSNPQLSTSFLEIPQTALDSVFAVSTDEMNLSCWYEIFFEFKVAMPLADFCIPTLGDIQDTHTIKTSVGGSRL